MVAPVESDPIAQAIDCLSREQLIRLIKVLEGDIQDAINRTDDLITRIDNRTA